MNLERVRAVAELDVERRLPADAAGEFAETSAGHVEHDADGGSRHVAHDDGGRAAERRRQHLRVVDRDDDLIARPRDDRAIA